MSLKQKFFISLLVFIIPLNQALYSQTENPLQDIEKNESILNGPEEFDTFSEDINEISIKVLESNEGQFVLNTLIPEIIKLGPISAIISLIHRGVYNSIKTTTERAGQTTMAQLVDGKSIKIPLDSKKLFFEAVKHRKGASLNLTGYHQSLKLLVGNKNYNICLQEHKEEIRKFFINYLKNNEIDEDWPIQAFDKFKPSDPNTITNFAINQLVSLKNVYAYQNKKETINIKVFKHELNAWITENKVSFGKLLSPHLNKKKLTAILFSGILASIATSKILNYMSSTKTPEKSNLGPENNPNNSDSKEIKTTETEEKVENIKSIISKVIMPIWTNPTMAFTIINSILPLEESSAGNHIWKYIFNASENNIAKLRTCLSVGLLSNNIYQLNQNFRNIWSFKYEQCKIINMLRKGASETISSKNLKHKKDIKEFIEKLSKRDNEGDLWYNMRFAKNEIVLGFKIVALTAISLFITWVIKEQIKDQLENIYVQYNLDKKLKSLSKKLSNLKQWLTTKLHLKKEDIEDLLDPEENCIETMLAA